jgi:hypothetical protein
MTVKPPRLSSLNTGFGSQRDLWSFAHSAANRGDTTGAFEAWNASSFCLTYLAAAPQFASFLEGKKSILSGELTAQRAQAISEIESRCSGFEQHRQEASQFANDQKSRLAGTPFVASRGHSMTAADIRELLSSESPDAVAMGAMQLLQPWQDKLKIPDKDPREAELSTAIALSRCDLGYDCTPNGTESLEQCVYSGVCGQDVRDSLSITSDQQRVARINAYRQQLVEAIRNRNWAAIGL